MGHFNITLWLGALFFFSRVLSLTVEEDTIVDSPEDLEIGSLYIDEGVSYTILNNAFTTVANLDNKGTWVVTSTRGSPASVAISSASILNYGDLVFDTLESFDNSIYSFNSLGTFANSGNMWLGISTFSEEAPIVLGSTYVWTNSGKIYLKQAEGESSPVSITQRLGTIRNEGGICIERTQWVQSTTIGGSGCVNVMDDGLLELSITRWNVGQQQTFYLSTPSSVLSIVGLSAGNLAARTYNVIGFGGGNEIRLDSDFSNYTYENGILSLSYERGHFNINIGEGYSESDFVTNGQDRDGSIISYSGDNSGDIPDECLCETFPVFVFETETSTVASETSKPGYSSEFDPSGSVTSDQDATSETANSNPGVTNVTSDATSGVFTSEYITITSETDSIITELTNTEGEDNSDTITGGTSPNEFTQKPGNNPDQAAKTSDTGGPGNIGGPTIYSTTWETTDGGKQTTESGVVIVSTDSEGSLVTTTSLLNVKETTSEIEYTDVDGVIGTKTVVICESTEPNGDLSTFTSVPPYTTTFVTNKDSRPMTVTEVVYEEVVNGVVTAFSTSTIAPHVTINTGKTAAGRPTGKTAAGKPIDKTYSGRPTGTNTALGPTGKPGGPGSTPSNEPGSPTSGTTQTLSRTIYVSAYEGEAARPKFGFEWLLSLALLAVI